MSLFSNNSLSQRVFEAGIQAEQSAMTAQEARTRVLDLEAKVNKLTLVNHALFELIALRTGITESELIEKVNEIDLRDGKLGGKPSQEAPVVCEQCGRSYSRRHNHCFYCDHVNPLTKAF